MTRLGLAFVVACLASCAKRPTAMDVCEEIVAAGAGAACRVEIPGGLGAAAVERVEFDLPSAPGRTGQVLRFDSDAAYDEAVGAYARASMLAGPHRYGSRKSRIFVQANADLDAVHGAQLAAIVTGKGAAPAVTTAAPAVVPAPTTKTAASAPQAESSTALPSPSPSDAMDPRMTTRTTASSMVTFLGATGHEERSSVLIAFGVENTTDEAIPLFGPGTTEAVSVDGVAGKFDSSLRECSGSVPPHGRKICGVNYTFRSLPSELRVRCDDAWFHVAVERKARDKAGTSAPSAAQPPETARVFSVSDLPVAR